MGKLRAAVVGLGYLGKIHAEKYGLLAQEHHVDFVGVCDRDTLLAASLAEKFHTKAYQDYHDLIGQVDVVSIVTPTVTHYDIAKFFLSQGIHVLLEKPITQTVVQANELIHIAKEKKLVLQVGHLERFNNVLKAVENLIHAPKFIESHRLSVFNPRGTDVNVMLDLMIHDIDIIQHLVKSPIQSIRANGASILTNQTDIVNARIEFENFCVANVTASRVSLRNERRMRIFQTDTYITLDLIKKHMSLHQKGEDADDILPDVPEIITEEKQLPIGDALLEEIKAFLHSVSHHLPPVVTGEEGRRALATAVYITHLVNTQFEPEKQIPFTESILE